MVLGDIPKELGDKGAIVVLKETVSAMSPSKAREVGKIEEWGDPSEVRSITSLRLAICTFRLLDGVGGVTVR